MFTKTLVAAAGVAALVLWSAPAMAGAAAPAASTASSPSETSGRGLAAIQAKAAADIAARVASLDKAIPAVTANSVITAADKTALLATLNTDLSGLSALGKAIAGETTAKQAATDAQTIFTSYRVYALALPQVRYGEAADDLTGGVLPKLTDAQSKLAALLAGPDASKDTAAVQAAMTDLASKITAARTATTGMSATVLAYTPAQYDANPHLLDAARQKLTSAQADVKAARADLQTVLGALK